MNNSLLRIEAVWTQRQRRTAGCAACCQTQPTASRAPCRRLPSRCPPAPLSPPPPPKPKQLQYGRAAANCGGQPRPPRLLPSLRSSAEAATKHTAVHTNQRANSATQTRAESKSKRKKAPLPEVSAQDAWRVPRLCRVYAPKMELPRTRTTSPSPPRHSVTKVSPELQPLPRGSHGRLKETLKSWKKHEQPKENIDMNGTPAPTFSVKHEKKKKIRDEDSSLFSPGLINIIGEKHDKRIRVLFKNPTTEESCPSIMNLVAPSGTRRKKRNLVKKMPWK